MPYRTLGWRTAKGAADTTGFNPGNWTVTFDPAALNVQVTEFEVYRIVITGAAAAATFDVYIDTGHFDTNVYAAQNSWEPSQGLLILRAGQTLYLYYSSASSDGNQPKVTVWLRQEVALTQIFPQ